VKLSRAQFGKARFGVPLDRHHGNLLTQSHPHSRCSPMTSRNTDKTFLDQPHQPHPRLPRELAVASNLCVWVLACLVVGHDHSSARPELEDRSTGSTDRRTIVSPIVYRSVPT